jgi:PAS domain S-box-containing protein
VISDSIQSNTKHISLNANTFALHIQDVSVHHAIKMYYTEDKTAMSIQNDSTESQQILMDQLPYAIALFKAPQFVVESCNRAYKDILGNDNIEGKTISAVFPEFRDQALQSILSSVFQTGKPFVEKEFKTSITNKVSGSVEERFWDFSLTRICDKQGQPYGISFLGSDITESVTKRKHAEYLKKQRDFERTKLETIIAESSSAIGLMAGPDLVFEIANKRWTELVSPREYIGRKFEDVYPELVGTPAHQSHIDIFLTGEPFIAKEMKLLVTSPNGILEEQYFDYSNFRTLDEDGKPYGVYCSAVNVTNRVLARKAMEDKERRYRLAKEQLSAALKNANMTTWEIDLKTGVQSILEGDRHLFGETTPKMSLLEIVKRQVHPDDADNVIRTINEAIANQTPYVDEYQIIKPDGTYRWIISRGDLKYNDEGEPILLAGIIADITKRKKSEMELAFEQHKLETIFNQSPAAMALWRGQDLVFEKVNPQYQSIFGDRKLVGKKLTEALPELNEQKFPELLREVLATGKPFVGKEVLARVSPFTGAPLENRYYDFSYLQIQDAEGKPYGIYDHAIDVTDRVLGRLEMEKAKTEAERANQTKSSFLANMSHEIRTPLGAILGFTDLLKDSKVGTTERKQYLDTISRNGKALTRIIDDILDLAKVESGKLEIEHFEFSFLELIDDVMDVFRESTRAKNIFLRTNLNGAIPPRIISDPTRLRQILLNIVGNAVKFTDVGGVTIEVVCDFMDEHRCALKLLVKDTGVGISSDQQQRLFEPFMQADNSTTRKFGGTGLGLVLSRRLANALGGDVNVEESESNTGSTFIVSFLADIPHATHISSSNTGTTNEMDLEGNVSLEHLRVLVADDSAENQTIVHLFLKKYGAIVETAVNGREAVKMGISGQYDIILMDIQMPEMDGYEATRALREAGFKKPIVALTAHAMAEERARSQAAGCNAHVTKPLDRSELIHTIHNLVGSRDSKSGSPQKH